MRTYTRTECATFRKTRDAFGGLSNMAAGFPLMVNGVAIRTTEALYQACRFPLLPDVQRAVIDSRSPMMAKMLTKPHRHMTRPDWDTIRVPLMYWCLQLKLVQNWDAFGALLLSTGDKEIVEDSSKDPFWGAVPAGDTLVGENVLGRLETGLREKLRKGDTEKLRALVPLAIPDFLLYGEPITRLG